MAFSGGDEDVEAVLIIGESARGRSFSLNGYPRNTNPKLSALDLISYRPVTSCAADTRISVPCLITQATLEDPLSAAAQISLIRGFKARGFPSTWFSSHRVSGENDSLIAALASETDKQVFASGSYKTRTDKAILAQVEPYLKDPSGKSRITVIHSIGSHWSYSNRYEPAFGTFTPVCTEAMAKACSIKSLVNAYDNSLLATDDFISRVIKSLAGDNAFVIYTSDHGESLGEDGNFLHGKPKRPEQRDVPLIFWASDIFRQKHLERYSAALGHKGLPLTHDVIFHSMLDCAGITSTVIDRSLSLCSPPRSAR